MIFKIVEVLSNNITSNNTIDSKMSNGGGGSYFLIAITVIGMVVSVFCTLKIIQYQMQLKNLTKNMKVQV